MFLGITLRLGERKPANAYHHGDLRAALIEATFRQVDKAGHESVSIAALAKTLGVSQPAYHRHFSDKDALLAAVAARGFRLFSRILHDAVADRPAAKRLGANARAYVAFGRDRPGLYQLMFGSPLLSKASPGSELNIAARECFDLLLDTLRVAARQSGNVRDAVGIWASLHGIVQLERFSLLDGLRTRDVPLDAIVDDIVARLPSSP